MAQSLVEQVLTVERALGERMIESALVVIRAWMNELGEKNQYEEAHNTIRKRYNELFSLWLTSDDQEIDEQLTRLTGDAYQLTDAVYADLRLKRGLSPDMHGFSPDSYPSVMNYFLNCVRFREEDLTWLRSVLDDEDKTVMALMASSAAAVNIKENFSIDVFLALIAGMNAKNKVVSTQCVGSVLKLLIHYDIRIDFFRQIQDAFIEALQEMEDGGTRVLNILCALIELSTKKLKPENGVHMSREVKDPEDLPAVLQQLLEEADEKTAELKAEDEDVEAEAIIQWYPDVDHEYEQNLFHILPDTWLFSVLTEDNPEYERGLAKVLLNSGYRELMWEHLDLGEQIYKQKLRKKSKDPQDYINYAHCLLLKGDRMMAVENYRQARNLCKSVKAFHELFRPDRGFLVDKGVPLEQVYLIEDQMFL